MLFITHFNLSSEVALKSLCFLGDDYGNISPGEFCYQEKDGLITEELKNKKTFEEGI